MAQLINYMKKNIKSVQHLMLIFGKDFPYIYL